MKASSKKTSPTWIDVKAKLSGCDRDDVLTLLRDLYAANEENKAFIHARFALGGDVLSPYKTSLTRWLWPDISRGQDLSVSKAKKAIADYKKAVGRPNEMAELMTFYCEQAVGFCREVGFSDETYFVSLMGMFSQSLKSIRILEPVERDSLLERLHEVSRLSHDFGYGLRDEMDDLLADHSTSYGVVTAIGQKQTFPP